MVTVFQKRCPRCDRAFKAISEEAALKLVGEHVKAAHKDYDPDWDDD